MTDNSIIGKVHAALEHEPRIDLHHHPIKVSLDGDDVLTLEGEVGTIIAKKLALRLAAQTSGARGIIDHLHLAPSVTLGDGAIRDTLCHFLESEPVFRNCVLRANIHGNVSTLRDRDGENGTIEVSVNDGIVTLDGEVLSLSHKRLAGVIAWWTPGCRDVVNGIEVSPRETDSDDEISDALRIILEKDPLVHADQITIRTENSRVTLQGLVGNEEERTMAEMDAWYTLGVDQVENGISCRS